MNKPRGILIVHSDLSDRVARYIAGSIRGNGKPVTRRNVRYGYYPPMYEVLVLIDVEEPDSDVPFFSFEYVPYPLYQEQTEGALLARRDYHIMYATRISEKLVASLPSLDS